MKIIKMLVEQIEEEASGAEEYITKAMEYKDDDKALADTYAKLAEVELQHVDLLHAQVVRIIKAWQARGNETPPAMEQIYSWQHEKQIDHIARVRVMMNMYAGK